MAAGNITFSGLGAGTDFSAMIDELRKVEEFKINSWNERASDYESQIEAVDILTEKMKELLKTTEELSDMDNLIKSKAESTDESAVSAKANSDSVNGSFTVDVLQMASAGFVSNKSTFNKDASGNFDSLGTGTFSYKYGETEHEIELNGDMTIEDLVKEINSQDAGAKASLIETADGYVFQMQGSETGAKNTLSVSSDLAGFENDNWHKKEAQNAEYVLNGFTDQVLTSSTNQVNNVIEGVNMTFKDVTVEKDASGKVTDYNPISVTVEKDSSGLVEKVEEYVDLVNDMKKTINALSDVDAGGYTVEGDKDDKDDKNDEDKFLGTPLAGNSAVNRFESELNKILSSSMSGIDKSDTNQYSLLAQIGVKTITNSEQDHGLLEIDMEVLEKAVEDNPDAVANLLAGNQTTTNSKYFEESSSLGLAKAGSYSVTYDKDDKDSDGHMKVYIDGKQASYDEKSGNYTLLDKNSDAYGLSINFNSLTIEAGSHNDTINIQQGKVQELAQFFEKESRYIHGADDNGSLQKSKEGYQKIVDNLDTSIGKEITRLDKWEENQRLKYARLDALLGTLNAQMTANASAFFS